MTRGRMPEPPNFSCRRRSAGLGNLCPEHRRQELLRQSLSSMGWMDGPNPVWVRGATIGPGQGQTAPARFHERKRLRNCGQFKLCGLHSTGSVQRGSKGSRLPPACFLPATRWGCGRIESPADALSRGRVPCAPPVVKASSVESQESSPEFAKRIEQAWLISQQPTPIACSSCNSNGYVECEWCRGTGFFILGDNMLCEVPSRNTTCVICAGKGSARCSDCKGTGFRAKWLGQPLPTPKSRS